MDSKQEGPAAPKRKRGRETADHGRTSTTDFTFVKQDPSKQRTGASKSKESRKNSGHTFNNPSQHVTVPGYAQTDLIFTEEKQAVPAPENSVSKVKRKASVQLEPQQLTRFKVGSTLESAMSPSPASFQAILANEPVFESNTEKPYSEFGGAVSTQANPVIQMSEYSQLLVELQARVSEEWSQEAVQATFRNSHVKQAVAKLPPINLVNFKDSIKRAFAEYKLLSYLIQSRGKENPEKCWRCAQGLGPFTGKQCISISNPHNPFLGGTCGGCAWSGDNTSCSWNVNHDVGKQSQRSHSQVMAAKEKVDAARKKYGMASVSDSVPQYFEHGGVRLQYPGAMRLEDAVNCLVRGVVRSQGLDTNSMYHSKTSEDKTIGYIEDETE